MKKIILGIAAMLTMATSAFAEIGSLSSDLVFTPVTPCRIVDTRVAGGTIAANSTRGFKAWGANFTAQGGSATPCGIPQSTNVAALALNLVAVTPSTAGYITAFPTGVAQPTASTLNYVAGDIVANAAIVKVSQASLATDWTVYTFAATHFLADVTGYYSMPVATALQCTDVSETRSVPAGFNGFLNNTTACPSGYSVISAFCNAAGSADIYLTGSGVVSIGFCSWRSFSGAAQNVTQGTHCCRIPGR